MKNFIDNILAGATPSIADCVRELSGEIPYLLDLESTPQDPGWHAEGNVFIHTGMVLEELYQILKDRPDINGEKRAALILGAALHDIAKPVTTCDREISGTMRVAAPKHEMRGRSYLVPLLMGQSLSYSLVESVLGLVGYHIDPKFLVVRDLPRARYLKLSRCADPELLYLLELADMRGRTCADQVKQVEAIELFGLFAQEHRAWQRFGDDSPTWREQVREQLADSSPETRDLIYGKLLSDLEEERVHSFDEAMARSFGSRRKFPEVVVTIGPSGSGKSTWVRKHLDDHQVISLDEIREELGTRADQSNNGKVLQLAKERLREQLRAGGKVVWDATSLRRDFRKVVADLAEDYGALVTFVLFHCSSREYAEGNQGRAQAVPRNVAARQLETMQWPELWEAHRTLIIGHKGHILGCFGRVDEELPYGLANNGRVMREDV